MAGPSFLQIHVHKVYRIKHDVPGDMATVAFLGCSLTTEAFLAKPSVAKV